MRNKLPVYIDNLGLTRYENNIDKGNISYGYVNVLCLLLSMLIMVDNVVMVVFLKK